MERKFTQEISKCNKPIVFVGRGAIVDSMMLFPALADYSLASSRSTFGFPRAHLQGPGVVTQALRRRVTARSIRRWVLL